MDTTLPPFCVECRQDLKKGERVLPVATFNGGPIDPKWAIHLDCLTTPREAAGIAQKAAIADGSVRSMGYEGPYGYGARPW